jgi:hypothetical protein
MLFARLAEINSGDAMSSAMHAAGVGLLGTSIAGLLGYVPIVITTVAGIMAIIMYTLTVLDHPRYRAWVETRQKRRQARRIAKLKAKQAVLVAKLEAVERMRVARTEAKEIVEGAKTAAAIQIVNENTNIETRLPPL